MLVTTGEIPTHINRGGKLIRCLDSKMILDRMYRVCKVGSADCGFNRDESQVEQRIDGSGIADVALVCRGEFCAVTPVTLEKGLGRLAASARPLILKS